MKYTRKVLEYVLICLGSIHHISAYKKRLAVNQPKDVRGLLINEVEK